MRQFLIAFLVAGSAWACGCFSTATPCSDLGGRSVIFVADVIEDSGEGWGKGPGRVAIVEALQNVPEGLREAVIDTMAGTSCYRRLQAGKRYVIITSGPRYVVGGCNESFELAGREYILDAMRGQLRGAAPSLAGIVRKSAGRYSHEGSVAGAVVELKKGELRQFTTADSDGRYVIDGLQAGRYEIRVAKEGFAPDEDYNNRWSGRMVRKAGTNVLEAVKNVPGEIEIYANACHIRDLAMWAKGGFRGTVRMPDGKPIPGVTVQAFGFDRRGQRESTPLRSAVSSSEGKYSIEPLPSGKYVIGINASKHEDESPYAPAVYDGGLAMAVGESRFIEGVDFVLPAPRIAARLRIRVLWPNGEPYRGASARLLNSSGVQRWYSRERSDDKGEIVAPVYIGERYTVSVSHDRFGRESNATADVEVQNKEQLLSVVLHEVVAVRQ